MISEERIREIIREEIEYYAGMPFMACSLMHIDELNR